MPGHAVFFPNHRIVRPWTGFVLLSLTLAAAPLPAAETGTPQAPTTAPATTQPDPNAPVIKVDNADHDFGTIWAGPVLEHAFKITNTGKSTLEIKAVRPQCGCTKAGEYPTRLEPGATGDFAFKLQSSTLRGTFAKSITVESNDPVTPQLRLVLKGHCKQLVEVQPVSANFGNFFGDDPAPITLKVTNNSDQPTQISLATQPAGSAFSFELMETEPGRKWDLVVTPNKPIKTGMLSAMAVLNTGLDNPKELRVAASGRRTERLDVMPATLMIAPVNVPAGQPARIYPRTLWVTNHGEKPVTVTEVSVDDPALTAKFTVRTPGKSYQVTVDIPADYLPPEDGRKLTIKTDDDEKPVLEVPILRYNPPAPPAAAATQPARPAAQLIGQPTPDFALQTVAGKSLSRADLAGRITVMNFIAPNCGFCKRQMPVVEAARAAYEPRGVRFVNIVERMGSRVYTTEEMIEAVKQMGSNLELAPDADNKVGRLFRATGYPTMFVVGPSGKIEHVNIGLNTASDLRAQLDALLKAAGEAAAAAKPASQPQS